jgi:hypothetical protein
VIVIGTDIVEAYFRSRAGHRGIKAVRSQYDAWLAIAGAADWKTPIISHVCLFAWASTCLHWSTNLPMRTHTARSRSNWLPIERGLKNCGRPPAPS